MSPTTWAKALCSIILSFCLFTAGFSQQQIRDSLIQSCNSAMNDREKIVRLGRLSDYYYANKQFNEGDSLIEKQIMLAEASLDRDLVLYALFGNAGYRSTGASTRNRSKNTISYVRRAIEYAVSNDLYDYSAMGYSNLAELYMTDGQLEEAFKNSSLAFTTALNTENDSAKIVCAIQLGRTYLSRSDLLTAFKTFNNAQNIAIQNEKQELLPPVYHAFSQIYKKLGKNDIARNYVFRSLAINKKTKNLRGQADDYIMLAKLSGYSSAKEYLHTAIHLADKLHNFPQKIEAERILFSYMLLNETPEYMLAYLEAEPELKNVFKNTGPDYLNWMLAEIYLYSGQPGNALAYFKKAENSFNSGYDLTSKRNFFMEMASCYKDLNNIAEAITYYLKSIELAKATADLSGLKTFTGELKTLYQQQGLYKEAFQYSVLHDNYKDSVDILGKEKELAVMEIDNETKRQKQEAEQLAARTERRYNMQYMLITIIVAAVFLALIMIGMFKVSTLIIRLMGFLSLIFLFEFVILFLDKWIHHITHGEPWKVWLIKIGIISILLPIHHYLEHRLIHYLLSRHLIVLRSRLSLSKFISKKKKPLPKLIPKEEQSVTEEV